MNTVKRRTPKQILDSFIDTMLEHEKLTATKSSLTRKELHKFVNQDRILANMYLPIDVVCMLYTTTEDQFEKYCDYYKVPTSWEFEG